MFVYEYLKQNPRLHGALIKRGLSALCANPETPKAVKQELKRLLKLTVKVTDAKLYWYGWCAAQGLLDHRRNSHVCDEVWNAEDWLNHLYSFVQINPERGHLAQQVFKDLTPSLITLPLAYKEVALCCDRYDGGFLARTVFEILNAHYNSTACRYRNTFSNSLDSLAPYFTLDFIRKVTTSQLRTIIELRGDTPQPDPGKKYKSLSEFKAAHDAWTKSEIPLLPQEKTGHIVYAGEFLDIVNSHGFILPSTKNDLLVRGFQHHNCVVAYTLKHCRDIEEGAVNGNCMRLLFAGDATCELNIHWRHGRIITVECGQYKGRYNKDIEKPETLTDLQIALTGRPISILHVHE